jgi:hypothetical protein
MNRKIICVFINLLIVISSFSQNGKSLPKGYAYSREVLGGVRPSIIADENGGTSTRTRKPSHQYYIYIETPAVIKYGIKSVWINGKQFSIDIEKVHSPVIIENSTMPDKTKDTLVAFTKNIVWQIQLKNEKKEDKKSVALKKLIDKNEMVIIYTCKGKTQLLPIKKIKGLSPVALQ